jgi:hypothetical protein
MQTDELRAADHWIDELVEPHRDELGRRALSIHREVDDRWVLRIDANLERALRELIRLVLATVPDGCEVYLAAARTQAAVARVGAGQVTIRWQIAGRERSDRDRAAESPVPLHPVAADAGMILEGAAARATQAAFEAAGWEFQLDATPSGGELIARAHRA